MGRIRATENAARKNSHVQQCGNGTFSIAKLIISLKNGKRRRNDKLGVTISLLSFLIIEIVRPLE